MSRPSRKRTSSSATKTLTKRRSAQIKAEIENTDSDYDREKSIVAIISGHGLKTLDAVVETATVTATIKPSLAEAEEALRFHSLVAAS